VTVVVFDLETIPDTVAGRRLYGFDGTTQEVAAAMLARRREESQGKTDFLKPAFHRIVAVGAVALSLGDKVRVTVSKCAGVGERDLVTTFLGWLKKKPQLVSWNGGGFDLPVIRYRSLLYLLDTTTLYGPPEQKQYDSYLYRYGTAHVDLMDVLAGYGASTQLGLDELARLAGLPGKNIATGDQVAALAEAGDWQTISQYVGSDAVQTALLFLRWWFGRGGIPAAVYLDALRAVSEKVADDAALAGAIGSWIQEGTEAAEALAAAAMSSSPATTAVG
jgi:3'-5' exonuclease